MRRRPVLSIPEALARRTDEYRRHLLIASYSVIYSDTVGLLAGGAAPTVKSKAMSKRLAEIEARLHGVPVPEVAELVPLIGMMKRSARGMGEG